jgi:predicted transposase/invertase (TIGR01784 family)
MSEFTQKSGQTQQTHYVARSLYYWAKLYGSQLESGHGYHGLMPVICINILSGKHPDITGQNPYNRYAVVNEENYSKLTNKLSIHYIELGKFTQKWIDGDLRNNWLTFLKNPKEVAVHPHHSQEIEKALEHLKWLSQDPTKRAEHDARQKAILDRQEELLTAEQIGLQKGIEQERIDIALRMLAKGLDLTIIADYSGLSLDKVKELRDKNAH